MSPAGVVRSSRFPKVVGFGAVSNSWVTCPCAGAVGAEVFGVTGHVSMEEAP